MPFSFTTTSHSTLPLLPFLLLLLLLLLSTTTTTTIASTTPPSDIHSYLAGQNAARAAVGLAPLVWDAKLASYSQWWANQRRSDCTPAQSRGPYGENIFLGGGSGWSVGQAVAVWVVERRWYDYYSNSCSFGQVCGEYTQIVWRATRRVGCAKVKCFGGRGVFVACNYDPPGNYVGSRPY